LKRGGSAWESNPPETLLTPPTGFEVQEGHQCPVHFRIKYSNLLTSYLNPVKGLKFEAYEAEALIIFCVSGSLLDAT
jgi:hypothetical protein